MMADTDERTGIEAEAEQRLMLAAKLAKGVREAMALAWSYIEQENVLKQQAQHDRDRRSPR